MSAKYLRLAFGAWLLASITPVLLAQTSSNSPSVPHAYQVISHLSRPIADATPPPAGYAGPIFTFTHTASAAWHCGGKYLILIDAAAGQIWFVDPATGEPVKGIAALAGGRAVLSVDHRHALVVDKGSTWLCDLSDPRDVRRQKLNSASPGLLGFSRDGSLAYVVVGDQEPVVHVYNVEAPGKFITLAGHKGRIGSLDFSHDGSRIATAGEDSLRVWDAASGKELFRKPGNWSGFNVSFLDRRRLILHPMQPQFARTMAMDLAGESQALADAPTISPQENAKELGKKAGLRFGSRNEVLVNDSGDPLVLDAIVSSDGKRAAFFKCGDYSEPHRTNNPQLVLAYELSTGRVLLDAIVRDIYRELGISADGRFLIGRANTTTVLWALAP